MGGRGNADSSFASVFHTAKGTGNKLWAENKVKALEDRPDEKVYEKSIVRVGGMAGWYCRTGYKRLLADGKTQQDMRAVHFFFSGYGHNGYVRGTTTART